MIPDVQVPTYDQANGSLGAVYDPQVQSVEAKINELAPQQQAQQASLDQAKVNAFKDITSSANSKGLLFSGFTPAEEGVYTGTKYLPAVANLDTSFNNAKTSLVDKISQINANRAAEARGIVSSATTAAQDAAYKNAQLAIASQKVATSAGNSTASKTAAASTAATAINGALSKLTGKDGYLSPADYNKFLGAWAQDGYSPSQYQAIFGHYKNPNQPKNQYQ